MVSTALFDQPPFKNLIVNGLVLAADGKKMSKRLKNYPDPMEIVNTYGGDALRFVYTVALLTHPHSIYICTYICMYCMYVCILFVIMYCCVYG